MEQPLRGKIAFITGAARGQGRSHAVRLAEAGADIVGLDICAQLPEIEYPLATPDDLEETGRLVEKAGRRMASAVGDVRDRASIDAAVDAGLSSFGRLDIVIANAGVMPIVGPRSHSMAAWQICLDVMLTGVLNTVEATYPHLLGHGAGGSVIITGSMAAHSPTVRTTEGHSLGMLGYSAAKAALINLGRNYASMLAASRVRVNTVHPSAVHTPMIDNDMMRLHWATGDREQMKAWGTAIPVDAIEPADVSAAVLWLASDESRYVTGSSIMVDAGATMR